MADLIGFRQVIRLWQVGASAVTNRYYITLSRHFSGFLIVLDFAFHLFSEIFLLATAHLRTVIFRV